MQKHNDKITLSAPSSLLVFGEYFITEPFTDALCIALSPRASAEISLSTASSKKKSIRLRIVADHTATYETPEHQNTLFAEAWRIFPKYAPLYRSSDTNPVPVHLFENSLANITINTSAFFVLHNEVMKKRGLGSSETATVLLCAALALRKGCNPLTQPNKAVLAAHALETHRAWQKGRGSGYGVYASTFGGFGIYSNAGMKEWNIWRELPRHATHALHQYDWWRWNEKSTVISSKALARYEKWKHLYPEKWQLLWKQYKNKFGAFMTDIQYETNKTKNSFFENFISYFKTFRMIGKRLGRYIGVSANVGVPYHVRDDIITHKASGAGNECAIGISYPIRGGRRLCSGVFPIHSCAGIQYET